MRILLLQRMLYVPTLGGANKANRLLLEGFAKSGHQCGAVVPAFSDHAITTHEQFLEALKSRNLKIIHISQEACVFHHNNVEVHAVFSREKIHLYAMEHTRKFKPDWVLTTSDDSGQVLLESALKSAPDRVIYIVHTPLELPFGPLSFSASIAQTELLRKVAGVITVSNYVKDYLLRWANLESAVIPFPVYGPGPFENLASFGKGFVTLINPCAYKGICIFLELAKKMPEVQFAAVPTWGTTAADLAALEGLRNVKILEPADDIVKILRKTSVLLMPSLWLEAFPLLPIEAMLHGIPVIASNVGGLPESKLDVDYVLPIHPIESYTSKFDELNHLIPTIPQQNLVPWELACRELLSDSLRYHQISIQSREAALKFVAKVGIGAFEEYLRLREGDKTVGFHASNFEQPCKEETVRFEGVGPALDSLSSKQRRLLQLRAIDSSRKSKNPTKTQTEKPA